MNSALLALENGTVFWGRSIGVRGIAIGEIVFNTSMTGYEEIITDPSYSHQIVTFTYPHIGNVGINMIDSESCCAQIKGLVIRNLTILASNFRYILSLSDYLVKYNIVAISDIDTRKLTRLLRDHGVQNGCIMAGDNLNPVFALDKARKFSGLCGLDLVKKVSTTKQYLWHKKSFKFDHDFTVVLSNLPYHVVVYDFGVKHNIMRILVDRGCKLTVVPAETPADKVLSMSPDGIFLTNGPGDPSPCYYAIDSIRILLTTNIPIFGVCLGYQLLALAHGAKIIKMKFGHHGGNHPVKDLLSNRVLITTQNHGFTVDKDTLPSTLQVTHISLFDGTLQGIKCINKPVFGFQGHPEASPGPHDSISFFDNFIKLIHVYRLTK